MVAILTIVGFWVAGFALTIKWRRFSWLVVGVAIAATVAGFAGMAMAHASDWPPFALYDGVALCGGGLGPALLEKTANAITLSIFAALLLIPWRS